MKNAIIMALPAVMTLAGTVGSVVWLAVDPAFPAFQAGLAIFHAALAVALAVLGTSAWDAVDDLKRRARPTRGRR